MSTGFQSSVLAGYGLAGKDGPWAATPRDKKILNSRVGGEHAGHGNWMQSFNPKPYIQTRPSSKQYHYQDGPDIHVEGKFEVAPESRIPGITRSSMKTITGNRPPNLKTKSPYAIGGSVDASTSTEPMKGVKTVKDVKTSTTSTSSGDGDALTKMLDKTSPYGPDSPTNHSPVHVGPSSASAFSPKKALRYQPPDPDVDMVGAVRGKRHQAPPLKIITTSSTDDVRMSTQKHSPTTIKEKSRRPKKIVALME